MTNIIPALPVLLAGGAGTELWPLSRALYPKQFLAVSGPQTLFQQAYSRLQTLSSMAADISVQAAYVVGNEEHRFLVVDQLRELQAEPSCLLLEPVALGTAPAITLAALQATADGQDPVLLITPSDQAVGDFAAYAGALQSAIRAAADGTLVVLGSSPGTPDASCSYMQCEVAGAPDGSWVVKAFTQKPDLPDAEAYVRETGYYRNTGMFVMRASRWLAALQHFRPDVLVAVEAAFQTKSSDAAFVRPGKTEFLQVPPGSGEHAVLTQCPLDSDAGFKLLMVPLGTEWSSLGSWDDIRRISPCDEAGNASQGDVLIQDSRNTLVHSTSRLVTAAGLDDVMVVETPDAVLVASRAQGGDIKGLLASLAQQERSEGALHRRVHRPWGWYDSIDHGPRFQVKRIMVKPKASLSLQMHHHRAEHWIVVSGTAEVTNGDEVLLLSENQSTYIPLGTVHRLINPGTIPLEIIEIQSGSYLGEDDIVRFQDNYGRSI